MERDPIVRWVHHVRRQIRKEAGRDLDKWFRYLDELGKRQLRMGLVTADGKVAHPPYIPVESPETDEGDSRA